MLLNEFDVKNYENWIRRESKEEGREEGILLGKAYAIIELLEEVGEVSESLKNLVMEQNDAERLTKWHKAAAKAQSIEDFEKAIGLVSAEE